MGIPTGPQATQGAYGTCALFAMTEVVQEQLQLRYGIVLDVTRARNYLEENMRMHDLDRTPAGASAGRVAKALSGRVSLIPASHGMLMSIRFIFLLQLEWNSVSVIPEISLVIP